LKSFNGFSSFCFVSDHHQITKKFSNLSQVTPSGYLSKFLLFSEDRKKNEEREPQIFGIEKADDH